MTSYSRPATLGGVLACIIWGASIGVFAIVSPVIGPFTASGAECLIAGSILGGIAVRRGEIREMFQLSRSYYLLCGGFWVIHLPLIWAAISFAQTPEQVVMTGAFNYLWPCLTVLGSVLILGKRPGVLLLPGLMLTIFGLMLSRTALLGIPFADGLRKIIELFNDNPAAYVTATIAALAWALYSVFTSRYLPKNQRGAVPIFMLMTGPVLVLAGQLAGEIFSPTYFTGAVFFSWGVASAFSYIAWDTAMQRGDVVLVSTFSMLVPLFSTVVTCLVKGVSMTPALILASFCIVLGAYICRHGIGER